MNSFPCSNRCLSVVGMFLILGGSFAWGQETSKKPIVIAHRGASGYIPEHTEGAKVLAIAQGADFVEQDVVLTRDRVFVVCHDTTLQETTDVAERFPERKRSDGRFYMADFDWSEIQQLSVIERRGQRDTQAFSGRFPGGFHQRLMRLEDEIQLVQGLSKTLGRSIGIYVELKRPSWHREEMKVDMSAMLLELLAKYGYEDASDACYIQCFEAAELKHLKHDLHCQLRLVQLGGGRPSAIASDGKPDWKAYAQDIASYANGVGPAIEMLVNKEGDRVVSNGFVEAAHSAGMLVHPYTVRRDSLPNWASSIDDLHHVLLNVLKVDGFFTDFPDIGRVAVDR